MGSGQRVPAANCVVAPEGIALTGENGFAGSEEQGGIRKGRGVGTVRASADCGGDSSDGHRRAAGANRRECRASGRMR